MNSVQKILSVAVCVMASYTVLAQDGLPPKPEDGKCYAKCLTQEEWKEGCRQSHE